MTPTYDFIVIGSGSSGAVAAYCLQKAGARVLLLEAGKHFTRKDFPMKEVEYTSQLFYGGGAEFDTKAHLAFLRARCVGGTSIVNGALMDRFDEVAFADWRAASGIDFFTDKAMSPHYDFAESAMVLQEIPDHHRNRNAHLFIRGMENIGHVWKPLRRCQCDCATDEGNDCISCLGGCHRGSKQSTMETYVPKAQALGMKLETEVTVERIEHKKDEVILYARQHGIAREFRAPKVIVAACALGTTQLLLNSGFKKKLPALGTGFAMHPQYMNFCIMDEPVDAHKGVLQGAKSLDPDFRKRGWKLENVFAPPISIAVLFGKVGADLRDFMHRYRHFACIEVAIRDEATGTLTVNNKGRLQIQKQLTAQDEARRRDGFSVVNDLFSSLKPKEIVQCDWGFGLHLMGGCAIGQDGKGSVVNPNFQVHDYPNLYIADSSVFPNAPGINPALTVMALSHRMSDQIIHGRAASSSEQPMPAAAAV